MALLPTGVGCSLIPDVVHEPTFHNPFPQLSRVAVLPFNNLSDNPHVDQDAFASAYYNELQQIPGFEVVPIGVVRQTMINHQIRGTGLQDYRRIAQLLNVDAVVVGAVTDFSPYSPPRLSLAVDWYAANPCFHPIPVGYGLPWGTAEEEYIPASLVHAAEFELAKEQLKTQTPRMQPVGAGLAPESPPGARPGSPRDVEPAGDRGPAGQVRPASAVGEIVVQENNAGPALPVAMGSELPPDWPDPRGFVPPPPSPTPPECIPHDGPVITHIRTYNGHDADFTTALENYYYFRDDARFGGWQSYLQRSDDFIRFCCYQHITEMLGARGGAGETRVAWRWPIDRYER